MEFTESTDNILYMGQNEALHFDYLVDSMPHSGSLDPTTGSPHFAELSTTSNATLDIDRADK